MTRAAPDEADVVVAGACVTVALDALDDAEPDAIGTPVNAAVPVKTSVFVSLSALASSTSVHASLPSLIPHCTPTFTVVPAVAISAVIETCVASSTRVTTYEYSHT